jgi:hypothetical protein
MPGQSSSASAQQDDVASGGMGAIGGERTVVAENDSQQKPIRLYDGNDPKAARSRSVGKHGSNSSLRTLIRKCRI